MAPENKLFQKINRLAIMHEFTAYIISFLYIALRQNQIVDLFYMAGVYLEKGKLVSYVFWTMGGFRKINSSKKSTGPLFPLSHTPK